MWLGIQEIRDRMKPGQGILDVDEGPDRGVIEEVADGWVTINWSESGRFATPLWEAVKAVFHEEWILTDLWCEDIVRGVSSEPAGVDKTQGEDSMGWLIVRIEPNANLARKDRDKEPPVAALTKRHALRQPGLEVVQTLAAKHGFEVALPIGKFKAADWPLTAVVYTSPNKDGVGRSGSQVCRWLARHTQGEEE